MGATAQDRSRLLAEFATALTRASTDSQQVLECAARMASELIGDGVVVRLVNDHEVFDRVAVYHPDPAAADRLRELLPRLNQRADEGSIGQARRAGTILVRNDLDGAAIAALAGPLASHPGVASLGAALIAPLFADGRFLGSMSMSRDGRDRPYTREDTDLAADVAARVALAVAVARSVAQLRAERESYAQIVQTCAEGVWKIDSEGRTMFANQRMADILAVPMERLTTEPATAWLSDARATPWWRLGSERTHEVRLRTGDGQPIWAQLSVSPLPAPPGAPPGTLAGWLAMVTDITDRVRSRELGERLAQMQRLDSVGQLAGGIAHDFNNLLSIISGAVELMLAEVPSGSSAAILARQVGNAVDQGAALTRQLLAFGRGRPGTAETIDVHEVITELAPMLHRTLGEHIKLRIPADDPGRRPCRVRMDQGQLHQVIVNLASNARDAMDAGGRLSIDCDHLLVDRDELGDLGMDSPTDDDKAWFVRLAVSDTGTGMDAKVLRQAFEPFYTTKPPGQGTGLGLAGVYGIVRAAGGLVRLYSEEGHGCTVKVYLPAVDEPAAARASASVAAGPVPAPPQASTHVLVVEDNPALAEVVKRLLQPAGYAVTVALTPAAALSLIYGGTPPVDVVITDVVMPDLTGPELVARIHLDQPDLPVVYTSGYTSGVLGERAHLSPDAILVEKPFTRVSLLEAIDRAMQA